MKLLVTGAAGFIGSNYVRNVFKQDTEVEKLILLDKLTYAGTLENISDLLQHSAVELIVGDICDANTVERAIQGVDYVINFAAESHVDRSISSARDFFQTNILGVGNLLEISKRHGIKTFIQVSTDEVYGSIVRGESKEYDTLLPNSPYAASKASADLIIRSYVRTYGMDVRITRCVNNFGPYQNPEKFLPKAITNLLDGKKVPIYGNGQNIREWIHVSDHCNAITDVMLKGMPAGIYNVGSGYRLSNLELAYKLLDVLNLDSTALEFVKDRPGHDMRYALSNQKIVSEFAFKTVKTFDEDLLDVVNWYDQNQHWWRSRILT